MTAEWRKKEKKVRELLEQEFGVTLQEREVSLTGIDGSYRFDLVSPDGGIVGEIKTFTFKGKRKPHAKIAHTSDACLFLRHARGAKRRLLILTDRSFHKLYMSERQGRMAESDGIEIKLVPLS